MGTVLHRTTKEIRRSINTPDYPPADWLVNPDLSAVEGHPDSRWVIDGDVVRLPNEAELPAIEAAALAAAKADRMAAVDAKTAAIVASGIEVADGKVISTSLQATQNLQDIALGLQMGLPMLPLDVSTIDGGSYTIADFSDFVRIASILRAFKLSTLASGRSLRAAILACETMGELLAVEDNR